MVLFGKEKLLPEGQNYLTSVKTKDIFFPLCVYKFAQVESRNVALQNILKPGSGPGLCGGQGGRPESDLVQLLLPFFSLDFLTSASCSSLGFPEDCSTPRVSFSWLTLIFHLKLFTMPSVVIVTILKGTRFKRVYCRRKKKTEH